MGNTTKMLGALVIGTAVGAAMGVLFAPDKGARTRKAIRRKGEDLADDMEDRVTDMLDKVSESMESMEKQYGAMKNRMQDLVKKGRHQMEEMSAKF